MTKIGLLSDPHARPGPLREALEIFAREQAKPIICAGDIAGYFDGLDETVELLRQYDCKCIIGNHDQAFLESMREKQSSPVLDFLQRLPQTLEFEIDQKRVMVVHAQPPSGQHGGIKLLQQNGEIDDAKKAYWRQQLDDLNQDVLVVGHTHQVFAEVMGDLLLINPGSSAFNHSCMLLSLPDMHIQQFALGERDIIRCWNFSLLLSDAENGA